MAVTPDPLHFTLIPLMSPGHIIPMIGMAKLLATRGVTVTIIVTRLDATRFSSVVDRAVASGLSINLLPVKFPAEEAGLPPGCESVDCVPTFDLIRNFYIAIKLLQQPLENILKDMKPPPNCIISDKYISWTDQTSTKLQIPRIIFDGTNCFTQLVNHSLYTSRAHESVPPSEPFIVPALPDRIEFTRHQLPGKFNPGATDMAEYREETMKSEVQAYGMVVNSFEELEKRYVDEFRKVKNGKIWCIGPLSLSSSDGLDRAQRGNQASINTEKCLNWLNKRDPVSVIYACHGSLGRLSPDQFIELALGLESSAHPFILVVKGGSKEGEIEKWISDNGFEERTKEMGLVIRGWAPQVLILSHGSVGAFLTHCGWNSTLECVCAGLPMITWPMFAEQFLNEKLVVEILEIGVGVGAKAAVHLGEEEMPENRVTRDGIMRAVERVMDKGVEGSGRRKRVEELGKMAKGAVEEGGSSSLNISLLIQEIAKLSGKGGHGIYK